MTYNTFGVGTLDMLGGEHGTRRAREEHLWSNATEASFPRFFLALWLVLLLLLPEVDELEYEVGARHLDEGDGRTSAAVADHATEGAAACGINRQFQ